MPAPPVGNGGYGEWFVAIVVGAVPTLRLQGYPVARMRTLTKFSYAVNTKQTCDPHIGVAGAQWLQQWDNPSRIPDDMLCSRRPGNLFQGEDEPIKTFNFKAKR